MTNMYFRYLAATISLFGAANAYAGNGDAQDRFENLVNQVIRPVMEENGVPGMAIAVMVGGKQYFFNYGVASKESGRKVTEDTIFEIGSISKTFTAILASYAEARGDLSLSDNASKYLPALAGSGFDAIRLIDLGTYTAGGLPLQFPGGVTDPQKMITYYRSWRPAYAAGTHRLYSNPSIGLLGHLAAKNMGAPFEHLMERELFPALGLSNTFIMVPRDRMDKYAYGYSKTNKPTRAKPGMLDSEAYGVKATSADMIRFLEVNMNNAELEETLRRAIATTHTGYFQVGAMTQALGWEKYPYPLELDQLLSGNSVDMASKPHAVVRLAASEAGKQPELINKTGSTRGFGAYVAFVPSKGIGIVMLANRNYPNSARIKAAYRILAALDGEVGSTGDR